MSDFQREIDTDALADDAEAFAAALRAGDVTVLEMATRDRAAQAEWARREVTLEFAFSTDHDELLRVPFKGDGDND